MTRSYWYSDCSRIIKKLGYAPPASLEEGVAETVKYYREKGFIS